MKTQVKKWMSIMLVMSVLALLPLNAFATSVTTGATNNNGEITISGTVTNAVSGQEITVLVVEHGADVDNLSPLEIAHIAQTTPQSNGTYSVSFTMPVAKRTGTYDVYIGGTEVNSPENTSYTFPTEAPTTAPEVQLGDAKPAVNGDNAFYYFITITLNDGVATGFNVKHYPTEGTGAGENNAEVQNFTVANISGATVKVISVLRGIPDTEADREIATKATLSYTIGGNAGSVTDTESTTLNQTKPAQN